MLSKIFSSKVFYIAFSLLVSIALWMFVEINENQTVPHSVANVPVVRMGEDILNDRGFLVSSMTPDNMTLTFDCPRSVAAKLTRDTLSIAINLGNITKSGPTTLPYEIIYPPGIDTALFDPPSRTVNRISLYIDRRSSKMVRVDVPYSGGAAEGYICDQPEYSPGSVTVYGPAEYVSAVSSARVNIPRESLSTTYTEDLPFTLLGEDGEELDKEIVSALTVSDEIIHVNLPVRVIKEVTLTVELAPGGGATSQNAVYTISPQTITIAGDPEFVRDYNSINLGTIDLTRVDSSRTVNFPIALENYVTPISGETEAQVFVEVVGLDIKYLTVLSPSIYYINEPPGYTVEIRTQSVDVRIRGTQDDLASVTEANIRIVIDLSDAGPGTQRVYARVWIDGVTGNVGAIDNYPITVNLQEE